jgi:hypothetical protein
MSEAMASGRSITSRDGTSGELHMPHSNALEGLRLSILLDQGRKAKRRAFSKSSLTGERFEGPKRAPFDLAKGTDKNAISYCISRMSRGSEQRARHRRRAEFARPRHNITGTRAAKHGSEPGHPQKDEALQLARGTPRAKQVTRNGMQLRP